MKMNFINIIPAYPDMVDCTVSEIRRQKAEAGIGKVAVMLSFHPQGTPAVNHADLLIRTFRRIREELGPDPCVELGVLFQSFLGHGWSGPVPLTEEPWQNIVSMDGTVSSRICPLDPGFRDYVLYCVEETAKAGAGFLLVDDDFGLRFKECFCPLHVAEFNRATGKNLTQQDVIRMIETRPVDDPDVKVFSLQRREVVIGLAKEMRAAIDRVDPAIRCGMCTPYAGQGFANAVALALSNGQTKPLVRICNAVYGTRDPVVFINTLRHTDNIRYQMPDVEECIDEADTFPQSYYSESAVFFHAHLTQAILCGLRGAKLWMMEKDGSHGTQIRYEKSFAGNRAFYEELLNTVQGVEWLGPASPLIRPPLEESCHPVKGNDVSNGGPEWGAGMLGSFGIPYCNRGLGEANFTAIMGGMLPYMTDEQIRHMFRGAVLIDSTAAKILTERGFADLMGVRTVKNQTFFFTSERKEDSGENCGFMWDSNAACLEPLSDDVKIFSRFYDGIPHTGSGKPVSPGATLFVNRLGGRVAVLGWSPLMPYYKMLVPKRRAWLVEILDFLNGGTLEMTVEIPHQVLVRHGKWKNGEELVSILSLSSDPVEEIPLRCVRTVKKILSLQPDGTWLQLPFRQKDGICTVEKNLLCCEPNIFRFSF